VVNQPSNYHASGIHLDRIQTKAKGHVMKNEALEIRKPSRRKSRRKGNVNPLIFILAGLIILYAGFSLLNKDKSDLVVASNISPADIIYDLDPLVVGHEMDGSKVDQIVFYPESQPQPQVAVSEDEFDFGLIGATEVISHDFYLQNMGSAPLVISRAYTTCACTTATFSTIVIPPGKAAKVTLTLDAGYHDVRGQRIERGVIIENNDPNMPELEIWTQANVANQ
jgi:hypothetical protein